ncbi:helix-turn-helix domain-containing protein [bacterium]|nr:helix-turn-helix domain-containing protein [bacterium]
MGHQNGKEWFGTDEVAAALGKAPFTVREWCRHRRIRAKKRKSGRGNAKEWMISAEELKRIQDEGLLPFPIGTNHHGPGG